jgi:hypothetical protein
VLALATTQQSAKQRIVGLSSCRSVAKRRVVVRHVVAMSYCRSVQIEGLAYKPSDRATSRQGAAQQRAILECFARYRTTVRQRAVWRIVVFSLATRRKKDNNIGCVVAIDNATRTVPNQPP